MQLGTYKEVFERIYATFTERMDHLLPSRYFYITYISGPNFTPTAVAKSSFF